MRVANSVGVVAQCLLGHNFDLRFPGALILEPEGPYRLWRRVKDYFRVWSFAY